jgi:hypothetical protein
MSNESGNVKHVTCVHSMEKCNDRSVSTIGTDIPGAYTH